MVDERKMSDFDDEERALIPNALNELTLHCVNKGIQLGSTVTLFTSLPYQLYKQRRNASFVGIFSRVGSATIPGSILGIILSVGLMHMKLSGEEYNEYKIWDRAYRLRHSTSQNRVDRLSKYSCVMGGVGGFLIGFPRRFHPMSVVKGSLMGVPFGIIAHVTIRPSKS